MIGNMQDSWTKIECQLPDTYHALGIEISENVLVYDYSTHSVTIASMWLHLNGSHIPVWRDITGCTVQPTHWQYIKTPKEYNGI